jgi:hypothetical protein
MICKDRCSEYRKTGVRSCISKYKYGFKYCSICEVWIERIDNRCPCCNNKLRTRPRSNKGRKSEGLKVEA